MAVDRQASRNAGSRKVLAWTAALAAFFLVVAVVLWLGIGFGTPVTVTVDGYTEDVRSTQPDVRGLLFDLGLTLRPEDAITPAAETKLAPGMAVRVSRARPCLLVADGVERQVYSRAATVGALLDDAGLRFETNDEVLLAGQPAGLGALLPPPAPPASGPHFAYARTWEGHEPLAVRLDVRRAVPVIVDDGSMPFTIYTTASTLGEALRREQITLYLGDRVQPSLGSRVHVGMRAIIQRSRAVLISADGRTVRTRVRGDKIGDALTELGIVVSGSDRVAPALADAVQDNTAIRITRVQEAVAIDRTPISFESILTGDDGLEIDHQEVRQVGHEGEFRKRWQVVYEDGVEKSRTLIDAWVAAEPVNNITVYGQKLISRPLPGVDGRTYWRHIRMFATAYSKSTAGVSPSMSYFGITRLGLKMTKGIVAVDPTVIPLGTNLYVPGYGFGLAGD
ncbi:MAG TPA: ubiquitin-like domain-containing protein, partial [Anaerolineae bacterium]